MAQTIQIGLVGDEGVGKTSFWLRWQSGSAPDSSVLASASKRNLTLVKVEDFGQHTKTIFVDGVEFSVILWDLQGDREVKRVRALVYPTLSAVLALYAIDNEHSLNSIGTFWAEDTATVPVDNPRFLVGSKSDLRETGAAKVSTGHAKGKMGSIRARGYYECSSQTGTGVDEVIAAAVRAATNGSSKGCCIVT